MKITIPAAIFIGALALAIIATAAILGAQL